MSVFDGLDKELFTEKFLKAYLENGFTSMSKREIDLLILSLLLNHREEWSGDQLPTAFQISLVLRAKRSKIRSMMDELSFRLLSNEIEAKKRLSQIILARISTNSDDLISGTDVRIQIEDGFLREFAKSLVQADFGIVDTSFDKSIITLSAKKFLILVEILLDDNILKEIENKLKQHIDDSKLNGEKTIFRIFTEELVASAGSQIGKSGVKLAISLFTGGMSDAYDVINEYFPK